MSPRVVRLSLLISLLLHLVGIFLADLFWQKELEGERFRARLAYVPRRFETFPRLPTSRPEAPHTEMEYLAPEKAQPVDSRGDASVASAPRKITPSRVTKSKVTSPLDVDRSGRVDIVDAYLVARRLKSMQAPDPKWDFNGDGRIDGADVDFIATRAVRLGPPQKAQGRTGAGMKMHLAAVFFAAKWEAH